MSTAIALFIGGLILVVPACWVSLVVSMRAKFGPVIDAIRRMNRSLANPQKLKTAGQPGAWASVVHRVGRTSDDQRRAGA